MRINERERKRQYKGEKGKRNECEGGRCVSRRFRSRTEAVYYFNALSDPCIIPQSHRGVVPHNIIAPRRETGVLSEIETSALVKRRAVVSFFPIVVTILPNNCTKDVCVRDNAVYSACKPFFCNYRFSKSR